MTQKIQFFSKKYRYLEWTEVEEQNVYCLKESNVTLRLFNHLEGMPECEMTKKVYLSMVDIVCARKQPPQ